MVYSLVEDSIVYHSNEYLDEDLIYKNLRKKRKLEQRIRFLIDIFWIFCIAWKLREQWEREEEERLRKQYDPKERITYTLEQLIERVRSGRQYLYTLLLEFELEELLEGRLAVPFMKNFYDYRKRYPLSAAAWEIMF